MRFILLLVTCLIAFCSPVFADSSIKILITDPAKANSFAAEGSGFKISGGYIITANHVIEDVKAKHLNVTINGKPAQIVGSSPALDIAVLKADVEAPILQIDCSRLQTEDVIKEIGFPIDLNTEISLKGEVLTEQKSLGIWQDVFLIQGPAIAGMSGGPVMKDGKVRGVVVGILGTDPPTSPISMIVPTSAFCSSLPADALSPLTKK